jgi:hypothetical protein
MDQPVLGSRHGENAGHYTTQSTQTAEPTVTGAFHDTQPASATRKGRNAMLWGIASTVLSVVGFIGYALFEQYNASLAELRNDLKHFNETASGFVHKDDFQRFRDQTKEHVKELHTANVYRAQLEHELHTAEKAREEMAQELRQIRERIAFVEGQHAVLQSLPNPVATTK